MTTQPGQPDPGPQPDPQFIIAAMNQELERTNNNRLWLMAMLDQRTAEAQQLMAQLSQVTGELERLRAEQAAGMDAALEQDGAYVPND